MNEFIKKYTHIWGDNPTRLLEEYRFQLKLTDELDNMDPKKIDLEVINKIILWKLNRFTEIKNSQIISIKELLKLKPKEHRIAKEELHDLLRTNGIALPMASTILRFVNPDVFQIIDDRAYRVLYPDRNKNYPSKPKNITNGYLDKSTNIYFDYLDKLHEVCSDKLPYRFADRILYQLDKKLEHKIGQKIGA